MTTHPIFITEDHREALNHSAVWEIMYGYINPEFSEAYPRMTHISELPQGTRVWMLMQNCQRECDFINQQAKEYQL